MDNLTKFHRAIDAGVYTKRVMTNDGPINAVHFPFAYDSELQDDPEGLIERFSQWVQKVSEETE